MTKKSNSILNHQNMLKLFTKEQAIQLMWIPKHNRIMRNKILDYYAELVAEHLPMEKEVLVVVSLDI